MGAGRKPELSGLGYASDELDHPAIAAVGHPAFGQLAPAGGPSFLAPAAGLIRSLDVALPDYQGGQDFLAAWAPATSQFQPGFPQAVNDLQFLTGPSVADIDGLAGEEVVAGTASMDLVAFTAAGLRPTPRWPKLTTDWTVANPLIGSSGTLDTEAGARKVVVGLTRSGYVNAYATQAPACSPSSWPRFHHDNANSGDFGRDATPPGKPTDVARRGGDITFTAPGDDLLCGKVDHYEVATSRRLITETSFDRVQDLPHAAASAQPGEAETYTPPAEAWRYVAIRAVDEQGNVGRAVSIQVGASG